MSLLHEQLSEQFHQWEVRGRGWQVFDEPVYPEPPFRPFLGYAQPVAPVVDDGRRPTVFSRIVQGLSKSLSTEPTAPTEDASREEEPEPRILIRDSLVELQTSLPANLNIPKETFEQFLLNLSLCREPIAFELVGMSQRVTAQFATHPDDAPLVRRQLQACFPEAVFQLREETLPETWATGSGEDELVVEFGLAREFMLPLSNGKLDPFVGIIGALSELQPDELGLFQVLFQPTYEDWPESIIRSVTHADGKPFFVNSPELTKAAEVKVSRSLYAAVVRIALKTASQERTLQLARDLAGSLRVFSHPSGNELIPLANHEYPFADHVEDVLRRQSRRTGMLLNSDELVGFVHLPGSAVRSPALQRDTCKSKPAPKMVQQNGGILLGNNTHAGNTVPVRLSPEQRVRHTHVIGASGTGKSTLLFNLIKQDIENGEGIAVIDPHGDLIDRILGNIPPERIDDVILVDPSDEEYSVGFNILSAHSDLEKNLLASDLVSVFQRLSTSWGDQMGSVLQNAILAFLESPRRGTLADMRRFLLEPTFRNEFLKSVQDPDVVYYWQKGFPQLSGNKSIGSILTRLETFLSQKPIRYMVSQPENRLDFAQIMDTGKIFLAKLPEGLLGKENSYLLGTLLVSKFQQLAMSRQARQIAARRNFWIFADEFHNYITPSMAEILSGARKYRIGLTLAHHELHQLGRSPEVASAVMSHPFTRIVFRVGDDDARKLGESFSFFEARDLKNLETGQAICRIERSDYDFNLSVPLNDVPDETTMANRQRAVVIASRAKYATPRTEIETMLRKAWEVESVHAKPMAVTPKPPKSDAPASPPPVTLPVESLPKPSDVPKPAEVPKQTGPEEKKVVVPPVPEPSRDLGRGGGQHKAIQERIQTEAHALGFFAAVESRLTKDSQQAADVVLRTGNLNIAVEISVSTTTDHEFKNVKKCLDAGFHRVAVISGSTDRLEAIRLAVNAGLSATQRTCVSFHTPDEFIAELKTFAAGVNTATPATPTERVTRGYKIRRHAPSLSPEERSVRESAALRIIAEAMKTER